jgi:DNA-3-methyladenine glycosylase II
MVAHGTLNSHSVRRVGSDAELAASDPVMAGLVERLGKLTIESRRRRRPQVDAYGMLLRSVIGQQLSVKAAATIYGRLLELFGGTTPPPEKLLEVEPQQLRDVGLSWRKVEYVRDLAEHVISGELELDRLDQLSDEQVIAEITAVRGFGVWSAQMFLIFFLERPDVLAAGDLGIRRAVQVAYGLEELPSPGELEARAEAWRPHRTLACIYLWESLTNEPV